MWALSSMVTKVIMFTRSKNESDHVYEVYLSETSTILGNKRFNVDMDDSVIINKRKYKGTPGLYELIFKRIPIIYVKNDK